MVEERDKGGGGVRSQRKSGRGDETEGAEIQGVTEKNEETALKREDKVGAEGGYSHRGRLRRERDLESGERERQRL